LFKVLGAQAKPGGQGGSGNYVIASEGVGALAVIEAIGRKGVCIVKMRREPGLGKATSILPIDCRNGALGRIRLENPDICGAGA